ncbi:hypothetical protein GF325_14220 [Candidatus Bathyarchaeota archaeon]|nr:hypothetical protein [Candidatus Bathyarchaeota archaeon]
MDRILIKCKQCSRMLVARPGTKTRKCAACGYRNDLDNSRDTRRLDWKDCIKQVDREGKGDEAPRPSHVSVVKKRIRNPG